MVDSFIQPSFSSGEVSPSLYGRVDLAKYRVGAALARNFFVDYRGGLSNRPGTLYIGTAIDSNSRVRLIPFEFSVEQTYVLEFGNFTLRFIQDGGYIESSPGVPYQIESPYPDTELDEVKFAQSADVMTFTHPNFGIRNLTRYADTNWVFSDVTFQSPIAYPSSPNVTVNTISTSSDVAGFSYVVTAIDETGYESAPSNPGTNTVTNIGATSGSITVTWNAITGARYYNVYKALPTSETTVPIGCTYGYMTTAYGLETVDNNITPDFTTTPPKHYDPFALSRIEYVTVSASGSGYVQASTDLVITDATGTGARLIPVVISGQIQAVIVQDEGYGYTAPVVTATGVGTGATFSVTLTPSSGTFPSVCCYFQQRKVFAATLNEPATLWMTKPGNFENMDRSQPTVGSDALELTLSSTQVNRIKALVPMPGGLVVLTSGGAWQISGGQPGEALTATSATATPQAYNGCSDVPPLVVNYDILYVQSRGSIVRSLSYNFYANIYTGTDLTVISNHLFQPHVITEWAWAEEPFKLVYCVRSDGVLLTMSLLKEQEVYGWTWNDTQGFYESVCTVQEGEQNAVYVVVRRLINGTWKRMIERFANRLFPNAATNLTDIANVEDAWFVDCGLAYPLVYPAAGISVVVSGTTATITASAGVFSGGDVGSVLRVAGGIIDITGYTSSTILVGTIRSDIQAYIPGTSTVVPADEGEWSLTVPVTTVTGLDHLNGMTVKVLGDGNVFPDAVVVGGSITLSEPCSRIIVGLPFTSQLQTLPLEVGDPTIQGKRKKISALTVQVDNTRGLEMGPDFDHMYEYKMRSNQGYGQPIQLETGKQRIVMSAAWTVEGQICVQQTYPLPASVLAVIPEITIGDTV